MNISGIAEAQTEIESLGIFGIRKTLLVGRGATALCVLYRTIAPDGGRVILPAIGCPSLLATALISNLKPVIVDVDRNLNIDPDEVKKIIQPGDIVLGVHIFGIPCQIQKLKSICEENYAFLIEDAAQAVGGSVGGKPLGTFGDASILSFASGKILPTNGGGAILTDDENLYSKLVQTISTLPDRSNDFEKKSASLRNNLTDIFNRARLDNPDVASGWFEEFERAGDIYNYPIHSQEAGIIIEKIKELGRIRKSRIDGVTIYREALDLQGVEHIDYPVDCCPFRFSFILSGLSGTDVQKITDEIRLDGMHASNLYLPLHWLAPDRVTTNGCPFAEYAGMRIINLWLNDGIPYRDGPRIRKLVVKWLR
jgi:dTDP-4-amino-4,6-dideoxygalactose transaminase